MSRQSLNDNTVNKAPSKTCPAYQHNAVLQLKFHGKRNGIRSVSESCADNPFGSQNGNKSLAVTGPTAYSDDCIPLFDDQEYHRGTSKKFIETRVAPDGGWGWVVFFACAYNTFVTAGTNPGFSIEFASRIVDQPTTFVLWTYNTTTFLWFFSFVLTGPITKQFGWRRVGLVFSSIGSLAYILLAFCTSMTALFVLYGVTFGLSAGIIYNIGLVILPHYFNKRRGLVLGLNVAVIGLSHTVSPQIVRALQVHFGTSGAILIHAGLVLNTVAACTLFDSVEKHQIIIETEVEETKVKNYFTVDKLKKAESNAQIIMKSSTYSIPGEPLKEEDTTQAESAYSTSNPKANPFTEIAREINKCIVSFRSSRVIINSVSLAVYLSGYANFLILMPLMMFSSGYGSQDIAWAASCSACFSFVGRVLMALVSDRSWFSNKLAYMSGATLAAITTMISPFVLDNPNLLLGCLAAWGLGVGMGMGLWIVLLLETMGIEAYTAALGACGLASAVVSLTTGPFAGLLRDLSSSYVWSVACCAGLQLAAALLWLFMPCAVSRDERVRSKNSAGSDERKPC